MEKLTSTCESYVTPSPMEKFTVRLSPRPYDALTLNIPVSPEWR
jgi:hypothetical protein